MDLDLRDDLDRSFGHGPLVDDTDRLLEQGHAALRRRRLAGGLSVLAVGAAVGLGAALVSGVGSDDSSDRPPIAHPGGTGTVDEDFLWRDLDPVPQFDLEANQVIFDADGVLLVRPGATVIRRTNDPRPVDSADRSVATITRTGDRTYWSYAYWRTDESAGSSSVRPQDVHGASFEDWVAGEAALLSVEEAGERWVVLDHTGSLRPVQGARIVAQTSEVPQRIAPTGSTAAIAMLSVGDARICAYARRIGDRDAEYLYLNGTQSGPDLAGCVANMGGWD